MKSLSRVLFLSLITLLLVFTAACGTNHTDSSEPSQETITIYNGQHKDATTALANAFEKQTGIKVVTRDGSSNELAHQIVEEGNRSPADIIYTEESTPLIMLAEKGLLTKINDQALKNIPADYEDKDGKWLGLLGRSRVVVYNPKLIKESQLPKSVLDFAKPEWKGKVGYVPTSGAFQQQISAMIKLKGKSAAKAWLEGLKKYGVKYKKNTVALEAVERGEVATALINNYYWDRQAKEKGANHMHSKLYFFGNQDLGDMVTVSGAGILKSSKHQAAAQKFLTFASSEKGQQILTDMSSQYPLNSKTKTHGLKPFSELNPPEGTLYLGQLGDGKAANELLEEVGLL
ncbi:iron ABC transporter substrate-binding protein [Camelliibacillus cellulosilyticus]|uniref:Iron ABC transporter substrate-binding protein n=1 Tax=Camelliibacillus cellulosilyticus TaxID=2174486 RepID=A0ABV9GT94_9BACL